MSLSLSNATIAEAVGFMLLVIGIVVAWGQCEDKKPTETVQQWKDSAQVVLVKHDSLAKQNTITHDSIAQIKIKIDKQTARINNLNKTVTTMQKTNDQLLDSLQKVVPEDSSNKLAAKALEVAEGYKLVTDSLHLEISTLQQRDSDKDKLLADANIIIGRKDIDIANLTHTVVTAPVEDCKILFVKCPSRKASFVSGVLVSLIAVAVAVVSAK